MLVVSSLSDGVPCIFILRLQDVARRTPLAALLADYFLAAHGADVREHFPHAEASLGKRTGETNRRILTDFSRDASCIADRRCDFVAHDTGRRRLFGERAGPAREEQLVVDFVLAGEQQIGTGPCELEQRTGGKGAHHSEQKRKRICLLGSSSFLRSSAGDAIVTERWLGWVSCRRACCA
jgi:hypothetical protein